MNQLKSPKVPQTHNQRIRILKMSPTEVYCQCTGDFKLTHLVKKTTFICKGNMHHFIFLPMQIIIQIHYE